MPQTESQQVLAAIEKQGERADRHSRDQLSAINNLASELRDFGQNISGSIAGYKGNGKKNGDSTWTILFGVAAMIFGLMAPMYIMISGISTNVAKHENLPGHPPTSSALAAMGVNLIEIETQFKGVSERINTMIKSMDRDDNREERDIRRTAIQGERILSLERKVFKIVSPMELQNGSRLE